MSMGLSDRPLPRRVHQIRVQTEETGANYIQVRSGPFLGFLLFVYQ